MPMSELHYAEHLEKLQAELLRVQRWVMETGQRLLVLFEGRDAAGKGGTIKAITEHLNTRGYRIVALPKPSEHEAGQWYFQRYVAHLPAAGEIVLFDRSWYNRAVVEPALGFCTKTKHRQFLHDCPRFEKLLTDDGILLFKYWLAVDQKEQERRFRERANDPLKRWKLSPVDIASRRQYAEFGRLRDTMLEKTHAKHAPWFAVDYNDQKRGRLNLIAHLIDQLPHTRPLQPSIALPPLGGKLRRERLADGSYWIGERY